MAYRVAATYRQGNRTATAWLLPCGGWAADFAKDRAATFDTSDDARAFIRWACFEDIQDAIHAATGWMVPAHSIGLSVR